MAKKKQKPSQQDLTVKDRRALNKKILAARQAIVGVRYQGEKQKWTLAQQFYKLLDRVDVIEQFLRSEFGDNLTRPKRR